MHVRCSTDCGCGSARLSRWSSDPLLDRWSSLVAAEEDEMRTQAISNFFTSPPSKVKTCFTI